MRACPRLAAYTREAGARAALPSSCVQSRRMHMLVGLLSVGAELVAIIACTVAINKLSEIKRAVTSRVAQTTSDSPATHISCILVRLASLQPTAGVAKLLTSEPTMALWRLTANVNFFAGLVGLKGSSRGVGEPPLRGRYHAGKPLAHRTPKKNIFGPPQG